MNVHFAFVLLLVATVISFEDEGDNITARKHYGLSFHSKCTDYIKSFTCMTTCKSIGFQIFRMDFRCKCSCHALKTTTILPFFKWRTNGTTKTLPRTHSPNLYHVAGTLSPFPTSSPETEATDENSTTFTCYESTTEISTDSENDTTTDDITGNSTTVDGESENTTDTSNTDTDSTAANDTTGDTDVTNDDGNSTSDTSGPTNDTDSPDP